VTCTEGRLLFLGKRLFCEVMSLMAGHDVRTLCRALEVSPSGYKPAGMWREGRLHGLHPKARQRRTVSKISGISQVLATVEGAVNEYVK